MKAKKIKKNKRLAKGAIRKDDKPKRDLESCLKAEISFKARDVCF